MALPLDPNSGLPLDPATMQAIQQQELARQIGMTGGNARERMNDMTVAQGVNTLFPNAQMRQSQTVQQAAQAALADLGGQQQGEGDIAWQLRQAHALYSAVAPFDTGAAMKMADRIIRLNEQQEQQNRLKAQDQQTAQTTLENRLTKGTLVVGDPRSGAEFGNVSLFNDDGSVNPDWQAQRDKLLAANKGSVWRTQEQWDRDKASQDAARLQNQREIAQDRLSAASTLGAASPDELKNYILYHAANPTVRMTMKERAAIMSAQSTYGLNESDMTAAGTEMRAVNAAASAIGRRQGTVAVLTNGLAGLADQVNNTIPAGRTDLRGLNALVAAGKTEFGAADERRYSGAIQSFVNEYARVLSGGSNQTSDASRHEAMSLLSRADSPEAVKAVLDQLAHKEADVLKDAAAQSVEELNGRWRDGKFVSAYPTLMKIKDRLGLKGSVLTDNNVSLGDAAPSPPQPVPASAATSGGLPPGWHVQQH